MLWAYNQNYFDFLNEEELTTEEGCRWIDRFMAELPGNRIGLDPYPTALRCINWAKFFCRHPECATKEREASLFSQYRLLRRKLEYHLLGNHLLEDYFALYILSHYFDDAREHRWVAKRLVGELREQTLPDGAHYEQSPMYHCILLDRLLDCLNFVSLPELECFARRWVGWLRSICYEDRSFPLFNDSAYGIAPVPVAILDYASRLGIASEATPLRESGYRKMRNREMEVFVDVGRIAAIYQPGHTHADTFNFELRTGRRLFLVDTGISTYEKTARRQYERSTAAHNTVSIGGMDSAEVWGGFRVGRRPQVTLLTDEASVVEGQHDGFGRKHTHFRRFEMLPDRFVLTDKVSSDAPATAFFHLSPEVIITETDSCTVKTTLGVLAFVGAERVELVEAKVATEYHKLQPTHKVRVTFRRQLRTVITG